jgi:hypothetical protein
MENQKPVFSLVIQPGHEEIWLAMRSLPKSFTVANLVSLTGISEGRAENYLSLLAKRGRASEIGLTTDGAKLYAQHRAGDGPVVFTERGKPSREYEIRRACWIACRMNPTGISATSIHRVVKQHQECTRAIITTYLARLARAGYLIEEAESPRDGEAIYVLRRKMNTGPQPPRLCEADLIYDVNTRQFFGQGEAQHVSLLEVAA